MDDLHQRCDGKQHTDLGMYAFWIGKFQEMYQNHKPFRQLDGIVGNRSTMFPDPGSSIPTRMPTGTG